jgi:ferredoxin-type protein NapG
MASIKKDRRNFIQYSTLGLLGLVMGAGVVGSPYLKAQEFRLRPPGAVPEDDFLALCIKCGQCLQVCPYHSIELADMAKGHGIGTPYIDALERGCYLCKALPCVLACPSGALDHNTEKTVDVEMGIAVLKYSNKCIGISKEPVEKSAIDRIYAHPHTNEQEEDVLKKLEEFEGKQCTICADMCPLPNAFTAIGMVDDTLNGGRRPEIMGGCVGCGACAELCPTSALIIEPRLTYEDYYIKGIRND